MDSVVRNTNSPQSRQAVVNQRFLVDKIKDGYTIYVQDKDGNLSKLDWPLSLKVSQAVMNQKFLAEKLKDESTIYLKGKTGGLSQLNLSTPE